MVRKLVSVPPSQRLVTKNCSARRASSSTISAACRLVPTNSTCPPRATVSLRKSKARLKSRAVWSRSTMWIPLREP